VSKTGSLDSCIDSCAVYNDQNAATGARLCEGLTWSANLTAFPDWNCFLKNNVSRTEVYVGPGPSVQGAAVLKGSK
jgi:hypothetical protein